jgi:hypothetical protein
VTFDPELVELRCNRAGSINELALAAYPLGSGIGVHGHPAARLAGPAWSQDRLIEKASPQENGYNESFNGKLRDVT